MEIELAGEKINLKLTMERIDKIEELSGHSVYSFPDKCADKSLGTKGIVAFYWQAQEGTAYSREQIFQKIMVDGLANHYGQVCNGLMHMVYGEKVMKQITESIENKDDPRKKS